MDPDLWGPHVWAAVHLIALGAPEKIDSAGASGYKVFFENLPYVIPCNTCREHFLEYLKNKPLPSPLTGRDTLFKWTVDFHNAVNVRLGKPVMDLETARKHWLAGGAHQSSNGNKKKWIALALVLGLVLALIGGAAAAKERLGLGRRTH